jgi:superfamily II DNA or RNA helicase
MSFGIPFATGAITLNTDRVSAEDAARQERTAQEILRRLADEPGLILADEVGMGKTFVALAVAASVALTRPDDGPVVIMVPPSLKHKWPKDWDVFCEHCLHGEAQRTLKAASADSGVAFLRLLDDEPNRRKAIIFLTHGALNRSLTDEWVKLALIRRALARRSTKEHVRRALPKFAGRLLRSQWVDHQAPGLWERLLERPPHQWLRLMQSALGEKAPTDDPVPTGLVDAIEGLDLEPVLSALESMPLRESTYVDSRLRSARQALSTALSELWTAWQRAARFHSPLLVFDEAHHLKNPTQLSSLFAEDGATEDSDHVSRGPLAGVFTRMLFLTATPFQLGHHELINVLRRFAGIAWDSQDAPSSGKDHFPQTLGTLEDVLNNAQDAALRLERAWGRLTPAHLCDESGTPMAPDVWWQHLRAAPVPDGLPAEVQVRYEQCHAKMREAETLLRPWVVRHLKPRTLPRGSESVPPKRREVLSGASIRDNVAAPGDPGLEIDREALLPFLLASRAQVALAARAADGVHRRAVFAEGLASSYEAYLETRQARVDTDGEDGTDAHTGAEDPEITWYLSHLDRVLPQHDEEVKARHPKVVATIDRALQLWWAGEKTLIFCHYRATGRALRAYVSRRLEHELLDRAAHLLKTTDRDDAQRQLAELADRFFDTDGRLRHQTVALLGELVAEYPELDRQTQQRVIDVALRFLRTPSFLVRYFPIDHDDPVQALTLGFDRPDGSGLAFRSRVDAFCRFLAKRCVTSEREEYLAALEDIQTGTFRRESADADDPDVDVIRYLPNVRLANGLIKSETRRRLMLAFNTPFFPEILIASSVLAEGVDLHLDCRFVVHHDLSWNPSTIEQRTGRVDRIGSKAEKARCPIHVYLPFVTATQDEKMFRVVRDRERWFSVVMGEKYQLDEGTTEKLAARIPFPEQAARGLAFDLSVPQTPDECNRVGTAASG